MGLAETRLAPGAQQAVLAREILPAGAEWDQLGQTAGALLGGRRPAWCEAGLETWDR